MNNRNLRIKDFEFSVNPYVKQPNGIVLKKESVKFPSQENMRPEIYRKFLEWVKEQHRDGGLTPDETILELIDKHYDWNAYYFDGFAGIFAEKCEKIEKDLREYLKMCNFATALAILPCVKSLN